MAKLTDCIRKLELEPDDAAEIRRVVSAAKDERTGIETYIASLHDDAADLRAQLKAAGYDLPIRRVDVPDAPEPPQPTPERVVSAQEAARTAQHDATVAEAKLAQATADAKTRAAAAAVQRVQDAADGKPTAAPVTDKVTVYDENDKPVQADQHVVPGAEKTDAQAAAMIDAAKAKTIELAKLKGAQSKMRSGKPQKKAGGMFAESDRQGKMFALGDDAPSPPFFSALTRAIEQHKQGRASGKEWAAIIDNLKQKGVRPEEVSWSGVKEWLAEQKLPVTREALLAHLRENEVQVTDVTKGGGAADPERTRVDIGDWIHDMLTEHTDMRGARLADETDRLTNSWMQGDRAYVLRRLGEHDVPHSARSDFTDYAGRGAGRGGEATKFAKWQLPGGKNYRELLLTMPSRSKNWEVFNPKDGKPVASFNTEAEAMADAERRGSPFDWALRDDVGNPHNFSSGHFSEPNVLAHIRMNDRTGPNGERLLHVEEIQSDWHQKGRKDGYTDSPARKREKEAEYRKVQEAVASAKAKVDAAKAVNLQARAAEEVARDKQHEALKRQILAPSSDHAEREAAVAAFAAAHAEWREMSKKEGETYSAVNAARSELHIAEMSEIRLRPNGYSAARGVPDAPFKKTWHELALKRVMRYAAEHGYEGVTWTTGEQQVGRYNEALRKRVDRVEWQKTKDGIHLLGFKDGEQVVDTVEKESALSDAIGKSMGDKIIADKAQIGLFEGDDIAISDTGMAGFYDKILPDAANDLGKKYGAKVGKVEIDRPRKIDRDSVTPDAQAEQDHASRTAQIEDDLDALNERRHNLSRLEELRRTALMDENGNLYATMIDETIARMKPETTTVHHLPVTDAMREGVMKGQPMFDVGHERVTDAFAHSATTDLKDNLVAQLAVLDPRGHMSFRLVKDMDDMINGRLQYVDGRYMNKLLEVSTRAKDPSAVLGHELIHGFRDRGVINKVEWRVLEKAALADVEGLAITRKKYAKLNLSERQIVEEHIADMFGRWRVGEYKARGFIRNAFERIMAYIRHVGDALGMSGYKTMASIFEGVERGHIGKRDAKGGETDAAQFAKANELTQEPAFKRWFTDSKVVDATGAPLVVYHGTAGAFGEFWKGAKAKHIELPGFFFTPDPHRASTFAESAGEEYRDAEGYIAGSEGANVMPVYLSVKNPKIIELGAAEKQRAVGHKEVEALLRSAIADGHDGAVIKGWRDGSGQTQYVAFEPTQIKSTLNRGTWDGADPRVSYALPEVEAAIEEAIATASGRPKWDKIKAAGEAVRQFSREAATEARMFMEPMAMGSTDAIATAKKFANAGRLSREWAIRMDKFIVDNFTLEQQERMWQAGHDQDVLVRREWDRIDGLNKTNPDRTTDFYPKDHFEGQGLDTLTKEERVALRNMQIDGDEVFNDAIGHGLIEDPDISGHRRESYVPRRIVDKTTGQPFPAKEGTGGSTNPLDMMGRNLRTSSKSLKHMKHETWEETEAAAQSLFGPNATVVRNIRALPMVTAEIRNAVAGRALINEIRSQGLRTGQPTVFEGFVPPDVETFTIDNPAMYTMRPRFETDPDTGKVVPMLDKNDRPIIDRVPLRILKEFEGPLRAVLSTKDGVVYSGLMSFKARAMSVIMYSPIIHNGVEWGRAMPAFPGKVATLQIYFEGNAARRGMTYSGAFAHMSGKHKGTEQLLPADVRQAINAGLVPIGNRGAFQDISSISQANDIAPGQGWLASSVGFAYDFLSPRAGDAARRGIDKLGNLWHNTLLWERVADLQMGLYVNFRDSLMSKQGYDPLTAQRLAAHLANRYAGALPLEAMSANARKIANLVFFSRSFTFGNLGAMKDAISGLPADIRAQIMKDAGMLTAQKASSTMRKKSWAIIMADIGLKYAAGSVLASVVGTLVAETYMDDSFLKRYGKRALDEMKGYLTRTQALLERIEEDPWTLLSPIQNMQSLTPMGDNEPGKRDRILVGHSDDGSAIYANTSIGKVAGDFEGWASEPLVMANKKLSTFAKPLLQTFTNEKGFGGQHQHVYNPYDERPGYQLRAAGRIVMNFMGQQIPLQAVKAGVDMAGEFVGRGLHAVAPSYDPGPQQDQSVNAWQTFGPLFGTTFSKGAKGGEDEGEMYRAMDEHNQIVQEAMPDITKAIKKGDLDRARDLMEDLNFTRERQNNLIRRIENPAQRPTPAQIKSIGRYATPEQMDRINNDR